MPSAQDEHPSRCVCVCFGLCPTTNKNHHTNIHTHTHPLRSPYFCVGRSEKCQVPRTSPRVDVFVFVCDCAQTHTNTNTQTHTHTNTHKPSPNSVWVGRKNAKSPGRAPE